MPTATPIEWLEECSQCGAPAGEPCFPLCLDAAAENECRFCGTPLTAEPDATYGVIGTDGSLCCDVYVEGCAACEDGEAHPHEARDTPQYDHGHCEVDGCDADMSEMKCPNDKRSCLDHCGEDHT